MTTPTMMNTSMITTGITMMAGMVGSSPVGRCVLLTGEVALGLASVTGEVAIELASVTGEVAIQLASVVSGMVVPSSL